MPKPTPRGTSKSAMVPASGIDALIDRFLQHLRFTQGEAWNTAQPYDHFVSLALAVRDQIVDHMVATQRAYHEQNVRRVYYLSLEYLLGRALRNNLVGLGLYDAARERLAQLGLDLEQICELEPDAGLGNGGLGRLAACYLDSATTLALPFYGYGLRYEYGIFQQDIVQGWQVERPDHWLRHGSPWEIPRPEFACPVRLYGHVDEHVDAQGRYRCAWRGYRMVIGLPYDIPIAAYGSQTVNLLRLWSARRPSAKPSPRCCIQATRPTPGASCAWRSNTFSWPARSVTSSVATRRITTRWTPFRRKSPFSSMIRTPRSRLPS
jgi:starch phosphorylase